MVFDRRVTPLKARFQTTKSTVTTNRNSEQCQRDYKAITPILSNAIDIKTISKRGEIDAWSRCDSGLLFHSALAISPEARKTRKINREICIS